MNRNTQRKIKPSHTDKENADPIFESKKNTQTTESPATMKLPEFKF